MHPEREMKVRIILLVLLGLELAVGSLVYPKFNRPKPDNEALPLIKQEDIKVAFNFAEEQHRERLETENKFLNSGGRLSKTTITMATKIFQQTFPKSMELHRINEKLEDVTIKISQLYKLSKAQTRSLGKLDLPKDQPLLQECEKRLTKPESCDGQSKYRTLDGSCNNLQNPNWGKAFAATTRLTLADYADGIMLPRTSNCAASLPNPRLISTTISPDVDVKDRQFTHMLMSLGQYILHDTTQISPVRAGYDNDIFDCCTKDPTLVKPRSCISIDIPKTDIMYTTANKECLPLTRGTTASSNCKLGGQRQPLIQQNTFLDASNTYSSDQKEMLTLRVMKGGLLRVQQGNLLPESMLPDTDLCSPTLKNNHKCFLTGDFRVNLHPGILGLQTMAVRMHNSIAKLISADYPAKTDEELFQEARRLVGAQLSVMAYKEYLPAVLGPRLTKFFDLNVKKDGYTVYDPEVNPTMPLEFNTGAFRFGHSNIDNFMSKFGPQGDNQGNLDLRPVQGGVFPDEFYAGKMDSFMRGTFYQREQEFDRFYVDALTNHCMKAPDEKFGGDLVAMEVQRGREHGLPSYPVMVNYCFSEPIRSFDDLKITMTQANIQKLKSVYKCVEDVDFFMGGLLETRLDDAVVGPTFACIIGQFFQNLKKGDRFYFEHGDQAGSFSKGQLKEIRKMSLSAFLCQYSDDMGKVTADPLRVISDKNPLKSCEDIPKPNFAKWFDK